MEHLTARRKLRAGCSCQRKGEQHDGYEYKTEFSMWAISASPLVVTTPIKRSADTFPMCHTRIGEPNSGFDSCTISLKKQSLTRNVRSELLSDVSMGIIRCGPIMDVEVNSLWTEQLLCDTEGSGRPWSSRMYTMDFRSSKRDSVQQRDHNQSDVTPQGRPVKDGDLTVWARELTGGDVAVALYNEDTGGKISFDTEIGLTVIIHVYETFGLTRTYPIS